MALMKLPLVIGFKYRWEIVFRFTKELKNVFLRRYVGVCSGKVDRKIRRNDKQWVASSASIIQNDEDPANIGKLNIKLNK